MTDYILKGKGSDLSAYTFSLIVGQKGITYTIRPTNDLNGEWNLENCSESKITDDGNGVNIFFGKRKIRLNYGELDDLDTLLRMYKKDRGSCFDQEMKYISATQIQDVK